MSSPLSRRLELIRRNLAGPGEGGIDLDGDDVLVGEARRAYVGGRIDVGEFEAALDHIVAGGVGCERFPYLSALAEAAKQEGER